jgi:hypothetical protein
VICPLRAIPTSPRPSPLQGLWYSRNMLAMSEALGKFAISARLREEREGPARNAGGGRSLRQCIVPHLTPTLSAPKGGEGAYRAVGAPQICECRSHRGRERDRNHCWRCARDQGPARSCGRWSWPIPEPLALPMVGCRRRLSAHSRPTKKLPNSQRILQFAGAVNWERAACSDAALSTLYPPCYSPVIAFGAAVIAFSLPCSRPFAAP